MNYGLLLNDLLDIQIPFFNKLIIKRIDQSITYSQNNDSHFCEFMHLLKRHRAAKDNSVYNLIIQNTVGYNKAFFECCI